MRNTKTSWGKRILILKFQYISNEGRWGCWCFHHQQAILRTPAECPTTQLNSDTIYPEMASDSTHRLRSQSYKTVFSPASRLIPNAVCHLDFRDLQIRDSHDPLLGLINLLECLKKDFCFLSYGFIIRRYNSWAARWKRHIAQGMEKDVEPSSSL